VQIYLLISKIKVYNEKNLSELQNTILKLITRKVEKARGIPVKEKVKVHFLKPNLPASAKNSIFVS